MMQSSGEEDYAVYNGFSRLRAVLRTQTVSKASCVRI